MLNIRKLEARDIFPLASILNKIGFGEIKKILNNDTVYQVAQDIDKKDIKIENIVGVNIMLDLVGIIIANLGKVEDDIYKFLASVTNTSIKDIQSLNLSDFAELIVNLFRSEDFKDFFKHLSMFLK